MIQIIILSFLGLEYLTGNRIRIFIVGKYRRLRYKMSEYYNNLDYVRNKRDFIIWQEKRCMRRGCDAIDDSYGRSHPYDNTVWCENHCPCDGFGLNYVRDYAPLDMKKELSEMSSQDIRAEYNIYMGVEL